MKERWFNYRPLCFVFGFLLLGSVFSFYITQNLILSIIILIATLIGFIILAGLKKKLHYILIPLISFLIGVSLYQGAILKFNRSVNYQPKYVEARICNVSNEVNGMVILEADSCKFDNEKINDHIIVYVYDNNGLFNNLEVGQIIKFKPHKLYKSDMFYNNAPNSNIYVNDLKYSTSVYYENINFIANDKKFNELFKDEIKDNLALSLTNENTEIAYSALFGDKSMLSNKQYDAYKLSGVAHLLAVSGLHVGIIVGILMFILNFKKRKKWWKFFLITFFLLMYLYLCGYAVSIMRATIMSVVLMLSIMFAKEYDSFNSISIAGIIIFLINPFCVFDVAFLLSFSCVIGIAMLYKPIKKVLIKSKLNEKLVDAVAISLSTTLAIVVIMAYYFKTLNIISIIANVILIPIFTVAFTVIFVLSLLSVLPLCSGITILLYPINYLLDFINVIATILGNLAISNFNTIEFNFIAIIIYFILLLFMGRFCTAKSEYKMITTLPMIALLFYCLL